MPIFVTEEISLKSIDFDFQISCHDPYHLSEDMNTDTLINVNYLQVILSTLEVSTK